MRKIVLQIFMVIISLCLVSCGGESEAVYSENAEYEPKPQGEPFLPQETPTEETTPTEIPPLTDLHDEILAIMRETARYEPNIIEEIPNNEKILQIRTFTVENYISDTTRFFHTVEFADIFEPGSYEFTIIQEINDTNRPFNFHFYGERIHVCENGLVGDYTDILNIRITDCDGNFIQQIEGIKIIPWRGSFHISFEDFNFDGFPDMTVKKHAGGVRGGAPHYIWLWNEEINKFIFSEELSELSHGRNLEINTETRQVMAWFSSVTGRNYIFLEFIEGIPTAVSTLEWIHIDYSRPWATEHLDINPPEGYTTVLIRHDLITGEEEIWYEVW